MSTTEKMFHQRLKCTQIGVDNGSLPWNFMSTLKKFENISNCLQIFE